MPYSKTNKYGWGTTNNSDKTFLPKSSLSQPKPNCWLKTQNTYMLSFQILLLQSQFLMMTANFILCVCVCCHFSLRFIRNNTVLFSPRTQICHKIKLSWFPSLALLMPRPPCMYEIISNELGTIYISVWSHRIYLMSHFWFYFSFLFSYSIGVLR